MIKSRIFRFQNPKYGVPKEKPLEKSRLPTHRMPMPRIEPGTSKNHVAMLAPWKDDNIWRIESLLGVSTLNYDKLFITLRYALQWSRISFRPWNVLHLFWQNRKCSTTSSYSASLTSPLTFLCMKSVILSFSKYSTSLHKLLMYSACSGIVLGEIPLEFHFASNVLMLDFGRVFLTSSLSF